MKSLFFLFIASSVFALSDGDQASIRKAVDHLAVAWNESAGKGFADDYSADADFVNIFGMTFSGKEEIENRHIKILDTFLKGSTLAVTGVKIREVKPDVAVAVVHWTVAGAKEPMKGVFTHTFIKSDDRWEITSTQNTLIRE